jgi:hypothetical protein
LAIDGNKFKAVNNRDRDFTSAKVKVCLQQIDESIARYLCAMKTADRGSTRCCRGEDESDQRKNQQAQAADAEPQSDGAGIARVAR